MNQLTANTPSSVRAALWSWNASEGVLVIRAEPGGPLSKLDGRWSLAHLLEQFDGLARVRIASPLKAGRPGDPIDIRVTLLDGRPAHFFGAFEFMEGARPVLNLDNDEGCLMFDQEIPGGGRLIATTIDPHSHHGHRFMPATTRFLNRFYPWLKQVAAERRAPQ